MIVLPQLATQGARAWVALATVPPEENFPSWCRPLPALPVRAPKSYCARENGSDRGLCLCTRARYAIERAARSPSHGDSASPESRQRDQRVPGKEQVTRRHCRIGGNERQSDRLAVSNIRLAAAKGEHRGHRIRLFASLQHRCSRPQRMQARRQFRQRTEASQIVGPGLAGRHCSAVE